MLGATGAAHAVDASRLLSQYGHTAWRLQDGELPASAYPMAQTSDGYLWIGTRAGVVRYDGARFVPLESLTSERLSSSFIIALLGAKDGSLWIGTNAGLSRWKDGQLTDYPGVNAAVVSLAEDRSGKIWLLANGRDAEPLCEVTGSRVICHGKNDGLDVPGLCCDRMITDGDGTFWMGTDTSLVQWREHTPSRAFPLEAKINAGTPGALILAREPTGELWAGLPMTGAGLGLQRLVGGQWEAFQYQGLEGSSLAVQAMLRDREGALWIGTIDHGIYRLAAGRVDHFDSRDGLTGDSIYSFYEDSEGNIWVATSGGVDRFRDFKVWSYSTREGLAVDEVDSVLATRDGKIWAGTANSLDVLEQGQFHSLRAGKELPGTQVTSLFEDNADRLWVGLDEGLWIYASGKFTAVLDQEGKPLRGMVFGLAQDGAGDVWVVLRGRPSNLVRLRGDRVVETWKTPAYPSVRSVAPDRAGGLWLGLTHGDLARPGTTWQQVKTGLDTPVLDVAVARDGLVLGATGKGLIAFKDGALRVLTIKDGLPCDTVNGLVDDEDGSLWLAMACGLAKLQLADVESALRDSAHAVNVTVLDALDGMRSGQAPFQRKVARAPDGRLWLANGVVLQSFDPHAHAKTGGALPMHIESLTADRQRYALAADLTLPPLTHDVQIDYTAIGLAVPQHIRFRYRLDGLDPDWVDAGQRRQAFYTDLPPGNYRFRIAASKDNGDWEEAAAPLAFSVKPAFYQTSLFMLLVVALAALALWLLFAWRLAQVKVQMRTIFEERHAERERIARELHDTFLQAVQGLMLRFQSAMERIPPTEPARDLMERALDHADEVIIEGRDRVTQLRALDRADTSLENAIRHMGEELARDTATTFTLTVEGAHRPLDPAASDEILGLAKEAIANAFRHARASCIDVSIGYGRKGLTLGIVDDGVGFDVEAIAGNRPAGHWGLKGMHERARNLRARLALSSRPGAGTALELSVPASIAFRPSFRRWRRSLDLVGRMFNRRSAKARPIDDDEV
ncbi:Signal transduction histidine kinase [Dyella jiangningensis]|uniref:sensor histidine kinase n=1 Tax=Dyella sp. AtDHG13 TaxID=1938897 RepID=UPI00087FA8FA|nr:sensor histidine kinase [Dyella sp. AtDHG13]PXV60301.1 signal transduction histidine kinase [Dyella sp. AtDHG13]SDJ39877.1 Signal transduction histidine kinase [Dyella jiangningensis]